MLNVSTVEREVHTENRLVVGVDVSKDKLDLYAEHTEPTEDRRYELDDQIRNQTAPIERIFEELADYAEEGGLEGLLVVCEPTGGYEENLMQTARRLGHEVAYVNGEHVANASVIESGDRGKTDPMDARVIAMVAEMDKTQEKRVLEGEHALLRELGRQYEAEDQAVVRARNRLHDMLGKLFCDYDKSKKTRARSLCLGRPERPWLRCTAGTRMPLLRTGLRPSAKRSNRRSNVSESRP